MVNPEATAAMANLLNKLNSIESDELPTVTATNGAIVTESSKHPVDEKDFMKNILQRFYDASEMTTQTLIESSESDPEVKEALTTRRVDNGVQINGYTIKTNIVEGTGSKVSYYDVITPAGAKIAADLALYEAALLLAKMLNKGELINGQNIKSLLQLEETYYTNRMDAARFKSKAKKLYANKNGRQAEIFESRYQQARSQALQAKQGVEQLLKKY